MKAFLKKAAYFCSLVIISPFILVDRIEKRVFKSEQAFLFMGTLLGLIPGVPGSCIRSAYYSATLDDASPEVHIGFGSIFCHRDAAIGRHSSIGMYCILGCARIGEEVLFANRISIPSGRHQHLSHSGEISKGTQRAPVHLGRKCWIGEGAIIMADVGEGSVLGAGSVVTKVIPPRSVAVGNPAVVLRSMEHNEIDR